MNEDDRPEQNSKEDISHFPPKASITINTISFTSSTYGLAAEIRQELRHIRISYHEALFKTASMGFRTEVLEREPFKTARGAQ
jgi:hypothetical protein